MNDNYMFIDASITKLFKRSQVPYIEAAVYCIADFRSVLFLNEHKN